MQHRESILKLEQWLSAQIIGQDKLVNRLLIAILADGHLLVEGAPGLAKTKAIKILAEGIEGDFHRIQFTPDLLPSDITGTEIYRAQAFARGRDAVRQQIDICHRGQAKQRGIQSRRSRRCF